MLKQLLFISTLFLTTFCLQAQQSGLQQYIGQDKVLLVANFYPNTSYQKIDKETRNDFKINELAAPMLLRIAGGEANEENIEKVSQQLSDPAKVGLSFKDDAYIWVQQPSGIDKELYENDQNAYLFNFTIPVTDGKKFRKFLNELMAEERLKDITKTGSANTLMNDNLLLLWDDKHLVLSISTVEYSFFEEREEFEVRRTKFLEQHAKSLANLDSKKSLASNKEYQTTVDKTADFNVWVNYDNFNNDPNLYPREIRGLMESLASLTEGNRISAKGFFRNGELEVVSNFKANEAMQRMWQKGFTQDGLDQKFYKYIDNTNLMGLYTLSSNTKGLMTSYGEEIYKAFQASDDPESKIILNMIDIVDIFLDEEEIYELFQGDVVVAVNDLRIVEVERADFKYNEEEDKWEEVKVKEQEVMPIATMMLNMGNAQNIQHFIDLGVNTNQLTEKQKGVWVVKEVQDAVGIEFYIIAHDDLLFFSNDANLVKNLKSGFPKSKQLSAAAIQDLSQYSSYAFIDMTNISDVVKKTYEKIEDDAPNEIMELAKVLNRFEVKSYLPKGPNTQTDLRIQFQDKETNVLSLMIKGMSQYLMAGDSVEENIEEEEKEEEGVKKL